MPAPSSQATWQLRRICSRCSTTAGLRVTSATGTLVQLDRLERGRVHRDHLQSLAGDHPPQLGDAGVGQLVHAELADLVELQVGEAHLPRRRKGDRGVGCDLVGNDA